MELNELSDAALRERGLTDLDLDVLCRMARCISDAADDVAADTRLEAYDDATSRGGLRYRRARNRIVAEFKDEPAVELDMTDNALKVSTGSSVISFYAARYGVDSPSLEGSRTKRAVVTEMQLMLDNVPVAERHPLVLMYESDHDGLGRAVVGVLESSSVWSWKVALYDRFSGSTGLPDERVLPSYDQIPEAELPPLRRRDESDTDRAADL